MQHIEIGASGRYVLAVAGQQLERWLVQGFELVPRNRLLGPLYAALNLATLPELSVLWRALIGSPLPENAARAEINERLEQEALGPYPNLLLLTRFVARNTITKPSVLELDEPTGPARLSTDHYIVIETVDEQERAVPGIRCELVIAGGEVRTVSTGPTGVVRVDRIQAGRVIIRVADLDGSMWHPQEGEPSQPSGESGRSRVHVVKRGECLSRSFSFLGSSHTVFQPLMP